MIDTQAARGAAEVDDDLTASDLLALARRGLPVFPLSPVLDDTGRWEKRPLVKRGFYSASTDPAEIRGWWARSPAARPAIATGHPVPDPRTGEAMGRLIEIGRAHV